MRLPLLLTAILLASGPALFAQSLADVARQEGERRQTLKEGAAKTYTNKDLKAVPTPAGAAGAAGAAAPAGAADTPAADQAPLDAGADAEPADAKAPDGAQPSTDKTDKKDEARDQTYWSKRMTGLHAQLERDQTYAAALETRINSLTTDFVNRDDPAQRDQVANDRVKAISELERLRKNIEQDKRDIADLEEEARRAGVPPGWLR